ncbi:hypothetical protein FS842_009097 [Serendipita sp. 407]|nr:hypothetical protein FS842_009097 [Serendipita sp. 407]
MRASSASTWSQPVMQSSSLTGPQDARQLIKEINDKLRRIPYHPLIEESFDRSGSNGAARWTCTYKLGNKVVGEGCPSTTKNETKRMAALNSLPNLRQFRDPLYFRIAMQLGLS